MINAFITSMLLMVFFFQPVFAVKLFGVELITATKTTLRQAAKRAGARLRREAGEFEFHDEYFSADILKGSDKLFLGFSKEGERFAFAEYEFKGLNHGAMLHKLINKYGQPIKIKQVFISDTVYRWNMDGVQVSYYKDWRKYKTRVSYVVPKLLAELKVAKKKVDNAIVRSELNKRINVY